MSVLIREGLSREALRQVGRQSKRQNDFRRARVQRRQRWFFFHLHKNRTELVLLKQELEGQGGRSLMRKSPKDEMMPIHWEDIEAVVRGSGIQGPAGVEIMTELPTVRPTVCAGPGCLTSAAPLSFAAFIEVYYRNTLLAPWVSCRSKRGGKTSLLCQTNSTPAFSVLSLLKSLTHRSKDISSQSQLPCFQYQGLFLLCHVKA